MKVNFHYIEYSGTIPAFFGVTRLQSAYPFGWAGVLAGQKEQGKAMLHRSKFHSAGDHPPRMCRCESCSDQPHADSSRGLDPQSGPPRVWVPPRDPLSGGDGVPFAPRITSTESESAHRRSSVRIPMNTRRLKMRKLGFALFAVLLLGLSVPTASAASISLFDYGFNLDGTIKGVGDPLPSNINIAAFDLATGLGTIGVTITGPGAHYFAVFVDHEIDEAVNTFFNEFGSTSGAPGAGLSWEIDEPGYVFGDIYDNFKAGALDGSNGVPDTAPDDVSMAMGWDFTLAASQKATIELTLSLAPPRSGFYLQQTDPDSVVSVYFASSKAISDTGVVPEPGTVVLLLSGLVLIAAARLRKSA